MPIGEVPQPTIKNARTPDTKAYINFPTELVGCVPYQVKIKNVINKVPLVHIARITSPVLNAPPANIGKSNRTRRRYVPIKTAGINAEKLSSEQNKTVEKIVIRLKRNAGITE